MDQPLLAASDSLISVSREAPAGAVRLSDYLRDHAGISAERLRLAETAERQQGISLVEAVRTLRLLPDEVLAEALAALYGWPCLGADAVRPETLYREGIESLGVDWALRHQVAVLGQPPALTVVVADPTQPALTDRAARLNGGPLRLAVASRRTLLGCLLQAFPTTSAHLSRDIDTLERDGLQQGAIPAIMGHLISRAVVLHASDIHIEPGIAATQIRYRVDGFLRLEEIPLPGDWHNNLVNIIQTLAGLKSGGLHEVKEGRLLWTLPGADTLELRVVVAPILTASGETQAQVILRLLPRDQSARPLSQLGYPPEQQAYLEELATLPHGLVLFAGPVNSGKSTTLYALLSGLASPDRKIVTIEDPVEVLLGPLIQQHQVNQEAGLTYAKATRTFLREDIDVMLVGEIRDRDTAWEIIQGAMTGRLGFSTMHAGGALAAISRLFALGIEPPYLGATLRAVIGQRLLRRLCPACRVPTTLEALTADAPALARHYGTCLPPESPLWTAPGCSACGGSGGGGRTVVAEILRITPELAELISHHAPPSDLQAAAAGRGFCSIGTAAWALIRQGVVGLADAERALGPTTLIETAAESQG